MPGFSLGKYYPDAITGDVFIGSTAVAGVTLPLSTGTAMTFGLWNTTANKNAVLLKLNIGYTSGTVALGEFGFTDVAATALVGNITAFTDGVIGTTIRNAVNGAGKVPTMKFTPSAATIAASTACYWTGISNESATTTSGMSVCSHDFDGLLIVPPGRAVFLVGSIAQTALYTCSLVWKEVDQ